MGTDVSFNDSCSANYHKHCVFKTKVGIMFVHKCSPYTSCPVTCALLTRSVYSAARHIIATWAKFFIVCDNFLATF